MKRSSSSNIKYSQLLCLPTDHLIEDSQRFSFAVESELRDNTEVYETQHISKI